MREQIERCPFCYPHEVCEEYPPEIKQADALWYVHAPCCDFDGPLFDTKNEAQRHWNRRTQQAATVPDASAVIRRAEALSGAIIHKLTDRQYQKISPWFGPLQDAIAAYHHSLAEAPPAPAEADRRDAETYTCVGKGGSYRLIGRAACAGVLRHTGRFTDDVTVYQDIETGELYCRSPGDFRLRMAPAVLAKGEGND